MSQSEDSGSVLDRIPSKPSTHLRLITFNINGVRTVFHYHPWTRLRSLSGMFGALHADIITLQELKVGRKDVDATVAKIDGYHSFISVPQVKKGYAGVGVYVRIPNENETESVKKSLKVVKAEEGITGILTSHDTKIPYKESDNAIGGYPEVDDQVATNIDSEGRCVVIELAINTVVISVYCPANSMGTEEGEEFRVQFLIALLARVRNLKRMGKEVILMGDINIARDLIDRADAMADLFKARELRRATQEKFEEANKEQVLAFIWQSIPRRLLNDILMDSLIQRDGGLERVLIDTTRKIQGRRQGMYTVWNTMTNSRPGNFGSRIDLILATEDFAGRTRNADIWPFLMGSDHCPVFSDFEVTDIEGPLPDVPLPRLEAKFAYKFSTTGTLDSMFAAARKRPSSEPASDSPASSPATAPYVKKPKTAPALNKAPVKPMKKSSSSNSTRSVLSFFKKPVQKETIAVPESPSEQIYVPFDDIPHPTPPSPSSSSQPVATVSVVNGRFALSGEEVPKCKHGNPCILKTARTDDNKGKKFWTCAKDKGEVRSEADRAKYSCGFFQWR